MKQYNFRQMLNTLTPKEAIIIFLQLGFIDNKYYKVEEISEFLNISNEEVIKTAKTFLQLYKKNINKYIDEALECIENSEKEYFKKFN